jgi:hypothetical protein
MSSNDVTTAAEPTVKTLYKLVLAECGDQGGFIGSCVKLFTDRTAALTWFDVHRKVYAKQGRDVDIFEEQSIRALVLGDGKTAYEIKHGPLRITQ